MTYTSTWEMAIGDFVLHDLSSLKIAIKNKTTKIPQTHDSKCSDVVYDCEGKKHSFKEVLLEQSFHMSFPCSNPEKAKEQINNSISDGTIRIDFRLYGEDNETLLLYVRDIGILDGKVHVMCVSPCVEKDIPTPDFLP